MISERQNMKKLIICALIASASIFTACGGGDDKQPPPNLSQIDPKSLSTLQDLINKLQGLPGACNNFVTGVIVSIRQQASVGGSPIPLPPAPIPQPSPDQNCNDAIKNAIYTSTRILFKNGSPWINNPASKMWLIRRLAGVINRFSPLVAQSGLNPATFMSQFAPQIEAISGGFINQFGPQAQSLAQGFGGGYGGGLAQGFGGSFGGQTPAYAPPQATGYPNFGQQPLLYNGSPYGYSGQGGYSGQIPGYASSYTDSYGGPSPYYRPDPYTGYPNLGTSGYFGLSTGAY